MSKFYKESSYEFVKKEVNAKDLLKKGATAVIALVSVAGNILVIKTYVINAKNALKTAVENIAELL